MLSLKFLILVFCVLIFNNVCHGMTRSQMKKTFKIMKNQCMPKIGVTEEQVGRIEQGVFMEEKKVMCYIACIYKTAQVIKNDRLIREAITKQIDILYPSDLKKPAKAAVENCIHIQDSYDDVCEASYWSAKCMYEVDPPNFVFA